MTAISIETAGVVQRLREGMASGVLSFPLTSFRDDGRLDLDAYRAYLADRLDSAPGAVFPACGTGEFFSLDEDEYRAVVRTTVEIADGRLPVVAGIG
ncbi:dihydrodipicolinate synthase family protein [Streptomyces resistomycificus]